MLRKRIQLGLVHTAVAITLVPFTSTLNRVMIYEMGLAATVVTLLVALPYLVSPIQVAIGSYSDRNPILGFRRTPYILLGLIACVVGLIIVPFAVAELEAGGWTVVSLSLMALSFGAWGMGYNLSAVSYLSLATELDEEGRGRTIAIMFVLMIIGIIISASVIGRLVSPYSLEALRRAFWTIGGVALILGILGLLAVEGRNVPRSDGEQRQTWSAILQTVGGNPQARLFFWYLTVLLAALLGQDVLLEPFAGQAFGLSVEQTTRITSIWGTCMLITLVAAGWLQTRYGKLPIARIGAWVALAAFAIVAVSGVVTSSSVFYLGVVLLGLGTGLATVTNLSLMLDMTTPGNVGLYIGAWGVANAMSRLIGQLMSGIVRDSVGAFADSVIAGYVVVFVIEALFILASLIMLRSLNVKVFQSLTSRPSTFVEHAAALGEAGS